MKKAVKKQTVVKTKNKKAKEAAAASKAHSAAKAKVGRKAQLITMMRAVGGTTVEEICHATGMQAHSARALISGIAKTEKVATSKETGKKTVYSIVA